MVKLNKSIFTKDTPDVTEEQAGTMDIVKNVRTTPRDPRFPTHNQANHCWNQYNEWLVCVKNTGDVDGCKNMRQLAELEAFVKSE